MPPDTRSLTETTDTTVRADSFLTLHYRLSDDAGNEYVSTFDLAPATLQMGGGQLADALEKRLLGLRAGQRRIIELASGEAFGAYNPQRVERIARSALPPEVELAVNSLVEFAAPASESGGGQLIGFLRELSETSALFDFNHPLAGKALRFEVEIIAIL